MNLLPPIPKTSENPSTYKDFRESHLPKVSINTRAQVNSAMADYPISYPWNIVVSFEDIEKLDQEFVLNEKKDWNITIDFPIYRFWIDDWINTIESRRWQSYSTKVYIEKLLESHFSGYFSDEYLRHFECIYRELFKNAMDHSPKSAYFGMKIVISPEKNIIYFILADEGDWVAKSISTFENTMDLWFEKSYNLATQYSFTSKPWTKFNEWIWLWSMWEFSKFLNLSLSSFDNWKEYIFNKINKEGFSINENIFHVSPEIRFYYLWTATYIRK
jgi:hypothetical protein